MEFVSIAMSLIQLTKKESMVWNEACKPRVQELKCWLVTMSMLKIPNVQENFVIYSDASKKKLGCVLMQHEKVIVYAS